MKYCGVGMFRAGATAALLACVAVSLPHVAAGEEFSTYVTTSGYPGNNSFYGSYLGSSPGETAFDRLKSYVTQGKNGRTMMLVIYGTDSSTACTAFENDWVNNARRAPSYVGGNSWNGYFRGSDKACIAAKTFIKSLGSTGNDGIIAFWGVAQDGAVFKRVDVLPSTAKGLGDKYTSAINAWVTFYNSHKYTPQGQGVQFEAGTSAGTRLEATRDVESVIVPIKRVTNLTKVENTTLRITYPDADGPVENVLEWAVNEDRKRVRIDVAGRWAAGKTVALALLDATTGKQIGSAAAINFVEGGNSFSFPDMEFDKDGVWGQWTLYTEDNWNVATQKVYAANMYSQPDTNNNASVEHVVMDIPIAPSNRYEVVYTNDIAFFAKEVVEIKHDFSGVATNLATTIYTNKVDAFAKLDKEEETEVQTTTFPGGLQVVTRYLAPDELEGKADEYDQASKISKNAIATNYVYGVEDANVENPVEWRWARSATTNEVECFTNVTRYAAASEVNPAGTVTTNYEDLVCGAKGTKIYYLNMANRDEVVEVPISVSFASNCVYAVTPQIESSAVTNLYSSAEEKYENNVEVKKRITILPCDDDEHKEPSVTGPLAMENDPSPVEWSFEQPDVRTYYMVASNREETVGQPYVCYGTNRTFYVDLPGCVTNEDVTAQAPVEKTGEVATTNFYFYALTNADHEVASTEVTWTNFEAKVGVECMNFHYTVVTNEYQHGAEGRAAGGRDGTAMQSFVLKVTGGAVWNAKTVAFASDVLDSAEFGVWCQQKGVVTMLEECSDPSTGASLFSYAVAANGRSGAAFLSRNSLEENSVQPPASNVFEVALYRPNGTLAGILAPQYADGKFDKDENLSRLDELLATAEDFTEPENGDAAKPLEAHFGRTVNTDPAAEIYTLNVSDKKDVFKLEGVPPGGFVSIAADANPAALYNGQEKPQIKVWSPQGGEIVPAGEDPNGNPVWRFADASRIYADVTAWTADYAATGKFGGTGFEYALTVTEAPQFPGVVSFVNPSSETFDIDSDTVIPLKVKRTGYTGRATATVRCVSSQLPEGCLEWAHDGNGSTNIAWEDGEFGEKTVPLTVKNITWEDSVSNMVFEIASVGGEGVELDETRRECTIGIQPEDDADALTGRIYIKDPEFIVGGVIWKKGGEKVHVVVRRERILNEKNGKMEARGEASAVITVMGGAEPSVSRLDWKKGARVGEQEFDLTMPQVGKDGEQTVVLTVSGTDCNGKPISDPAERITFKVVAEGAPEFRNVIDANAYQHVSFDETAYLNYSEEKMVVEGFSLLSGSLPAGLVAEAGKDGLRIYGVPSGTNSAELVYQLHLRQKSDGYLVKTMPVNVKIAGKALGGVSSGGDSNAVIPAFAERRVWQYLPMTNGEGRLTGLLNLSASTRGSLSARYTAAGGTVMFTRPALDSVEPDADAGGYRATARMEKAGYGLDVSFTTDGRVSAVLTAQDGGTECFVSDAGTTSWTLVNGGAGEWKGRYAAALSIDGVEGDSPARGTAAIAINMTTAAMAKTGRVTYNGVLPNGRPMNGTTAFVPAASGAKSVKLPIAWRSAADEFSVMLIATNAGAGVKFMLDPEVKPYWSGGGELSAAGGKFAAKDWKAAWKSDFGVETLRFKCDGKSGGATVAPDGMSIKVGSAGDVDKDGFALETIVLNRVSGVVTGTLKTLYSGRLATVNFRGVALPGDKERFMNGCAWHTVEQDGMAVRKAIPVEISK